MKTLKIMGVQYQINFVDDNTRTDCAMGRMDSKAAIININKSMPEDNQRVTLLHEVMHCLSEMLNLELTEKRIAGLSTGIFEVMEINQYYFQGM